VLEVANIGFTIAGLVIGLFGGAAYARSGMVSKDTCETCKGGLGIEIKDLKESVVRFDDKQDRGLAKLNRIMGKLDIPDGDD
jgi:hypothetical protein